jgi:hypothetical protein
MNPFEAKPVSPQGADGSTRRWYVLAIVLGIVFGLTIVGTVALVGHLDVALRFAGKEACKKDKEKPEEPGEPNAPPRHPPGAEPREPNAPKRHPRRAGSQEPEEPGGATRWTHDAEPEENQEDADQREKRQEAQTAAEKNGKGEWTAVATSGGGMRPEPRPAIRRKPPSLWDLMGTKMLVAAILLGAGLCAGLTVVLMPRRKR